MAIETIKIDNSNVKLSRTKLGRIEMNDRMVDIVIKGGPQSGVNEEIRVDEEIIRIPKSEIKKLLQELYME